MKLKQSLIAVMVGLVAAAMFVTQAPKTNSQSVVSAKPHTFSVLDYNQALEQYNAGQYALSYNTLMDANAPKEAYKAFGWDIK